MPVHKFNVGCDISATWIKNFGKSLPKPRPALFDDDKGLERPITPSIHGDLGDPSPDSLKLGLNPRNERTRIELCGWR